MHSVHFSSRAAKELRGCPEDVRGRLLGAVEALAVNPRPPGCKKLSGGLAGTWRIRVGAYRILYDVHDGDQTVLIVKIGPRKSVYQ